MATYSDKPPIKVASIPQALDGERGLRRFYVDVVRSLRDIADRQMLLEKLINDSGLGVTSGVAGETGILKCMLVHRTDAGVCYLADASDATRYATGIVTAVQGNLVLTQSVVTTDVFVSPVTAVDDNTPKLFLSKIPGYATTDAAESGAVFQQCVGWAMSQRNTTSGKARADIRCDLRFIQLT